MPVVNPMDQTSLEITPLHTRYRFAAAGTDCASVTPAGSFTTNSTAASCYSLNGGQTALVQFNQGPVGDFGDFYPAGSAIQAYTGSTTLPLSATSPEFTMLASIGYDPVTVSAPEPAGLLSLGTALPMMFAARRRMPRRVGAAA